MFNKELIFKYQIGSKGSDSSQFDEPCDICIGESGKLYVADKNNSRVQIFSESKRNRESKGVKLGTSLSFGLDGLFSASPTKSTKSVRSPTAKTKMFKTTGEFCFHNYIELDDKPIKLCSAPFSGNMAVSTKHGEFSFGMAFRGVASYMIYMLKHSQSFLNLCTHRPFTCSYCMLIDLYFGVTNFTHDFCDEHNTRFLVRI